MATKTRVEDETEDLIRKALTSRNRLSAVRDLLDSQRAHHFLQCRGDVIPGTLDKRWTILSLANLYGAVEVITFLIEKYPDALSVADRWDNIGHVLRDSFSAHFYGDKKCLALVKALAGEGLEVLSRENDEGETLLHLALYATSSKLENIRLEVVSLFVDRYPRAARIINYAGYSPLHCACIHSGSLQEVQLLLGLYPDAIKLRTADSGATPLHRACGSNTSFEVVRHLALQWPVGCLLQDWYGSSHMDHVRWSNRSNAAKNTITQFLTNKTNEVTEIVIGKLSASVSGMLSWEIILEHVVGFLKSDPSSSSEITAIKLFLTMEELEQVIIAP